MKPCVCHEIYKERRKVGKGVLINAVAFVWCWHLYGLASNWLDLSHSQVLLLTYQLNKSLKSIWCRTSMTLTYILTHSHLFVCLFVHTRSDLRTMVPLHQPWPFDVPISFILLFKYKIIVVFTYLILFI